MTSKRPQPPPENMPSNRPVSPPPPMKKSVFGSGFGVCPVCGNCAQILPCRACNPVPSHKPASAHTDDAESLARRKKIVIEFQSLRMTLNAQQAAELAGSIVDVLADPRTGQHTVSL